VRTNAPIQFEARIYGIPAAQQLQINHVFHRVPRIDLTEAEPGAAQTNVGEELFVGEIKMQSINRHRYKLLAIIGHLLITVIFPAFASPPSRGVN